jgi:hypothetical protein
MMVTAAIEIRAAIKPYWLPNARIDEPALHFSDVVAYGEIAGSWTHGAADVSGATFAPMSKPRRTTIEMPKQSPMQRDCTLLPPTPIGRAARPMRPPLSR